MSVQSISRVCPPRVFRFANIFAGFCGAIAAAAVSARGASGPEIPAGIEQIAKALITRNTLEAPIRFLASDALEGRGPATRGDQLARLYLATELEGLGYQAGFPNGQWQQPFDIVGIKADMPRTWSFQAPQGRVDLKWHDDYIAVSGLQSDKVSVDDAELVFVGYGMQAPQYKWDDFKGVNLEGKVLVMLNNSITSPVTSWMAAGTSMA